MSGHEAKNMKLISHNSLQGFGGVGEGMSLQVAKDGRRIMWLAHEGPPKNFTAVDVSDPRTPKVIVQTDLPHTNMRSNSLEICGDIMAVAYQTYGWDIEKAGIELFDISTPEQPKSISFFDCRGPRSRGVHCVWYVDGEFIHCASGAADYMPRHPRDDQCYRIIDVRNPSPDFLYLSPQPDPHSLATGSKPIHALPHIVLSLGPTTGTNLYQGHCV